MKRTNRLSLSSKSPYLILLGGFLILILLGSILLMLPFSTKEGVNIAYIDSLFLSTSAICVTGLVSTPEPLVNLLSPFGSIILGLLIEVGGLGFITLGTFAFSFRRKKVGVSTNILLKEAMNQNSYSELLPLAKKIVITSFIIQGFGFILNAIAFLIEGFSFDQALWHSLFHTCSSFNNAGFDILGSTSLIDYKSNILLMITTATLITLGGLGFVVMFDLMEKKKYKRLSVHSKIVLTTTLFIIVGGTLILKLTDYNNISWGDALLQVIFARTAGFYSVDLPSLKSVSILILCLIMFVGGSPGSIAGGVKTTTLYTIAKSIVCFGTGKKKLISYNREIKDDSILKSYVLVTVSFIFILIMTMAILVVDGDFLSSKGFTIEDIIFEAISAFATCGTSLGITTMLSTLSKIFIILLMYFGRLGPITFISLLNRGNNNEENDIGYIEEKIIIG